MNAPDHTRDKPLRLFYALWPDAATRSALQALQMRISGRHIRADNLHATLAFLGNQPASSLPLLEGILADLPHTGFGLQIDRLGYFKKKRIAWAGSHAAPDALVALQVALAQALERHGVAFDRQNDFTPHITLAREAGPPADAPFEPFAWEAGQVALVQSLQEGGRLAYRVLADRPLDQSP